MRSRSAVIAASLLVILAATGILAWQAQYAVNSHRAAAESVLRDYAALAADELVRRTAVQVGYQGYYPLVTALAQSFEASGDIEHAVRLLNEQGDERLRLALPLSKRYFVFEPSSGQVYFAGKESPSEEFLNWLESRLETPPSETSAPYFVAHGDVEGGPVTAVFRPGPPIVGFQVDLPALEELVRKAVMASPLLPPSLGRGEVTNDVIFASLVDHGGIERFRSSGTYRADFGVVTYFDDHYGGVLAGSRVLVSVDPAKASDLVIGGLPPSRLPVFLGLTLLTATLLTTLVLDLHRERANQKLRSEFVASVSHELRTPLAQIRMFAETLHLGRVRSNDERQRAIEVIDREARRLSHLVENVLQFSRAEREAIAVSPEAHPLEPSVLEALEQFHPFVSGKGIQIKTRFEPGVEAAFDPDALRQVLLNLLDNAMKYGPRGQEIVVGIESIKGGARVFVEDQGPGIPRDERERVLERFYRLERERNSAVGGTGIGLAVVRELVSRQRGRVFVESGPTGGTRVAFDLPAGPDPEVRP
ncbi:MAG TPA: HAMP domain-containing sensor histidine kinase [Vicinamibacteria bacterium]|nr:HAMP domain-containing sensor histidine kinase [Vicinamibacteria bacterium]